MKIIFMGTPEYARCALEALVNAGHEITLVVTQPDRPKGRSKELLASPVKEYAVSKNIPVFQPLKIRKPEAVEELKKYEADLYVVAAFGQILSKEVLDIPKFGCLNIHGSLLPAYRGASPVQYSILDGAKETGVTIMKMDEGIDTGDILTQKKTPILPTDTYEILLDRLSKLGAELIVETVEPFVNGKLIQFKQDETLASYCKMIDKSLGKVDFTKSAEEIERLVRALNPWPTAFTSLNGKQLKLWAMEVNEKEYIGFNPGEICEITKNDFSVMCGDNKALIVKELQLEGKKRMSAHDFLLGVRLELSQKFGE